MCAYFTRARLTAPQPTNQQSRIAFRGRRVDILSSVLYYIVMQGAEMDIIIRFHYHWNVENAKQCRVESEKV